jgi:hypothetical protein
MKTFKIVSDNMCIYLGVYNLNVLYFVQKYETPKAGTISEIIKKLYNQAEPLTISADDLSSNIIGDETAETALSGMPYIEGCETSYTRYPEKENDLIKMYR